MLYRIRGGGGNGSGEASVGDGLDELMDATEYMAMIMMEMRRRWRMRRTPIAVSVILIGTLPLVLHPLRLLTNAMMFYTRHFLYDVSSVIISH